MGGLNQVKLSMQQLFVTNLMRFLNFNLNNSFKMTLTLKVCLFYLARFYQNKIKIQNLYSQCQVPVNLVQSLGPSSLILLFFIDIAI